MTQLPCGCDHALEDCLCGCEDCQKEDSNQCFIEGCQGGYFCNHNEENENRDYKMEAYLNVMQDLHNSELKHNNGWSK